MSDPNNYTVGWISAIEIEYTAAQEFLDEEHEGPKWTHQNDENHYTLGRIGKHNVVIAVLPRGDNGVAAAALAAKDMMHSFPNVRVCLMVGIGGGAPSKRHDIRLGDVVVSVPTFSGKGGNQGGVVQYDYGRTIQERRFQSARYLNRPPRALLTAVNGLSAKHQRKGNDIDTTINNILQRNRRLQRQYGRPAPDSDKLYSSNPVKTLGANKVAVSELIERPKRSEMEDNPAIHYGLIASADGFMEDAQIRDILAEELDVLCFEMEAAGLMNSFPCLVIRGICDYSDRHWFKEWRGYAAMAAAAYAKALLEAVPVSDVDNMQTIKDVLPPDFFGRARSFISPLWGDKKKEAVSVSVMPNPEETQTKDRSKEQPYRKLPVWPAVSKSPVMGGVYSEESQTSDTDEDQPYQKLPVRPAVSKSPVVGGVGPKETQARRISKDQPYQKPLNQTAKKPPAKNGYISSQIEIKHVYIAVMGVTGAGKSSFISLCTGKNVKIGHDLQSCTADVDEFEFMFNDQVCVHLIDTPGFDDTSRSDVDVLQNIAVWLSDSFEHGTKLSGIIYLHRIIDVRMAGSTLRNLSMFKKLCGEEAYSSVVLATTMWNQVNETTGEQRERELVEKKDFWGYMHDKGSEVFRLDQKRESCIEIIKYIISLGSTTVLELQDEIVNQGRQIEDTEAGVQLNQDIIRERKKHEADLLALKTQMQEEMASHDAELQEILKKEQDKLNENIRRSVEEQAKLKQDLREVHERKEREFSELKKQLEEEQKEALRQQAEEYNDKLRLSEERNLRKLEMLGRKADAQEDRLRRAEDVNRKQQEALEQHAQEALERQEQERIRRKKEDMRKKEEARERQAQEEARRSESQAQYGDTPLHLAAREGEEDLVESLLEQGADIEAEDNYGGTPLFDAVLSGKPDMVHLLLNHGAYIEAKNKNGRTPFGYAIEQGKKNVARNLLDRGANIEARQNGDGGTILHVMASAGKVDMIDFLLDHGADIRARDYDYDKPRRWAKDKGHKDLAKMLSRRGG